AEDGIRAFHVTGVQTCALPISHPPPRRQGDTAHRTDPPRRTLSAVASNSAIGGGEHLGRAQTLVPRRGRKDCSRWRSRRGDNERSEERRVGTGGRGGGRTGGEE